MIKLLYFGYSDCLVGVRIDGFGVVQSVLRGVGEAL